LRELQAGAADWGGFGQVGPGHAPCLGLRFEATMSGLSSTLEYGLGSRGERPREGQKA